jgi:hypothetical protein
MARLDIKTLVLAFEKRINELEKNPPEQVPTSVVLVLLEKAVGEVITEHFQNNIKEELKQRVREQFAESKDRFINEAITEVLEDEEFKLRMSNLIKHTIEKNFL